MFVFFASLVAALAFIDVEYKNAIVVVVVDVVLDDIDLLLPGINNKNNLVRRVRATTTISLFRKIKENAAKQMQQQTNKDQGSKKSEAAGEVRLSKSSSKRSAGSKDKEQASK